MPVSPDNVQKWQLTVILMFRNLIQDVIEQAPQYDDEAIRNVLITAAKMVSGDLGLNSEYTINTETTTISPDPVERNDDAFVNLILLRGQLLLITGEWRKAVKNSMMIQLGPRVSMNSAVAAQTYKDLVKALKDQYAEELGKFKLNDMNPLITVISGSPVGPDYPAESEDLPVFGPISH